MQVVEPEAAKVLAQVVHIDTVTPDTHPDDTLSERATVGLEPLAQSVLECGRGQSRPRETGGSEEVLFVLAGRGALRVGAEHHRLEPESGAYLPPGTRYQVENDESQPLRMAAVRISAPDSDPGPGVVIRRLSDQVAQDATTEREFRIVADPESGLRSATHFVGYIPTARAPEHFHTYDEVIYVLDGEGVFQSEGVHEPLRAGTCIRLPARTVHCLHNTGQEKMRVLGVFTPAGSPAAAYYPDGTPAHEAAPPLTSNQTTQAKPHSRRPNQ